MSLPREGVLDEAKSLITGDRNNTYGPPTQDFERTAEMLNAQGYSGPGGRPLVAHDTAIIMINLKLSRLVWTPGKRDSWVDLAGYAGCGYECVLAEEAPVPYSDEPPEREDLAVRFSHGGPRC